MDQSAAMILAGGQGKRMDMLCHVRPKPALSFGGRYRVIDFPLSNCINSHIRNIAVLTDYQRKAMSEYLEQWAAANAGQNKLSVLPPESGSYAGTADAVYRNLAWLDGLAGQTLIVLAGDHVYKMDYRKMLAFHKRAGADATVGVIKIPIEEAFRFGTVELARDKRIRRFVEKSLTPVSSLASMGIYVFDKKVLLRRLEEDAARPESVHDFGYSIMPRMVEYDRVFAYRFGDYWQDIGTPEAYYAANMELLAEEPRFCLESSWPVVTITADREEWKTSGKGKIVNSLISPGCVIRGFVKNSILAPGVHVSARAEVIDSIVMADSRIGYCSIIDKCILDERVSVGEACCLGMGETLIPGAPCITVVGRGVTIPPRTVIGRDCKILPGVKPPDFKARVIVSGSTVTRD